MNAVRAGWLWIMALLLRLYPRSMRHEFAAEMHAVARARLHAAMAQGWWRLVVVALHEAGGLIVGAGVAWWSVHQRRRWLRQSVLPGLLPVLLVAQLWFPWDAWLRIAASYFCDQATPRGGSVTNQMACYLTNQPLDTTRWMVGGAVATVGLLLLTRWRGGRMLPWWRSS